MEKDTRISKLLDNNSYVAVMALYNAAKRNKAKYSLEDLVLIKSFLVKMINVQTETYDGDIRGIPIREFTYRKWSTPFEYLENRAHYACEIFYNSRSTEVQERLLDYFLRPNGENTSYVFNFDKKKDYGKLI